MQICWRPGLRPDPAGGAYSAPFKLVFLKTAHLEMLRLQNGLLRHSSILHTQEKIRGNIAENFCLGSALQMLDLSDRSIERTFLPSVDECVF